MSEIWSAAFLSSSNHEMPSLNNYVFLQCCLHVFACEFHFFYWSHLWVVHWPIMQLDCGWELIWSGLIRGLLTFSNLNSVVSFSAYLFYFFIISCSVMLVLLWVFPCWIAVAWFQSGLEKKFSQSILSEHRIWNCYGFWWLVS